MADKADMADAEEEWASLCSEDCQDDDKLCIEPYASGTTCSAADEITAYHMHFFYFQVSKCARRP